MFFKRSFSLGVLAFLTVLLTSFRVRATDIISVLRAGSAQTDTVRWTGNGSNYNWGNAANWDNGVPVDTSIVIINSAYTINLNNGASVKSLFAKDGSINVVAGILTAKDTIEISGSGSPQLTIKDGASVHVPGIFIYGDAKNLTVNSGGSLSIPGKMILKSGTDITNNGSVQITGSFIKEDADKSTLLGHGSFTNNGIIAVKQGRFEMDSGTHFEHDTLNVMSGASLTFTTGYHAFADTTWGTVNGDLILDQSTTIYPSNYTATSDTAFVSMSGNGITLKAGNLKGPGVWANLDQFTINNPNPLTINGSLTNKDSLIWKGSSNSGLYIGNQDTLTNLNKFFIDHSGGTLGGDGLIINHSLIEKTGSSSEAMTSELISDGTIKTTAGDLDLRNFHLVNPEIDIQSGTKLTLSGSGSVVGTLHGSNEGDLILRGNISAELDGANLNTTGNAITWNDYNLQGPGPWTNKSKLKITSDVALKGTLISEGTVTLDRTSLTLPDTAHFINHGTIEQTVGNNSNFSITNSSSNPYPFQSTGTIRINNSDCWLSLNGGELLGGNVSVTAGKLTLYHGGLKNTDFTVGQNGTVEMGRRINVSGTITGNNQGKITAVRNQTDGTDAYLAANSDFGATLNLSGNGFTAHGVHFTGSGNWENDGKLTFNYSSEILNTHFLNKGTITQSGVDLTIDTTGVLMNNGDYVIDTNTSYAKIHTTSDAYADGPYYLLKNKGTLEEDGDNGSVISVPLANSGTIHVTGGTLTVNGLTRQNQAVWNVDNGATLYFTVHRNTILQKTITGTNNGTITFYGNTIIPDSTDGGTFDISGHGIQLTDNVSISGVSPLHNNGALSFYHGSGITMNTDLLNDEGGILTWNRSGVTLKQSASIKNKGKFRIENGSSVTSNSDQNQILNDGVIKILPVGTSSFQLGANLVNRDSLIDQDENSSFLIKKKMSNTPSGVIAGVGSMSFASGSTFDNNGMIAPGDPLGKLTFDRGYNRSDLTATLPKTTVNIFGTTPENEYSIVHVDGKADITNDALHVHLLNHFQPANSDTFNIVTSAQGIMGSVDTVISSDPLVHFKPIVANNTLEIISTTGYGGPLHLSSRQLVGGQMVPLTINGENFTSKTRVHLVAKDVTTNSGHPAIDGTITSQTDKQLKCRLNLLDPYMYGNCDLIVSNNDKLADTTNVKVIPFLSLPVFETHGIRGIPVKYDDINSPGNVRNESSFSWGKTKIYNLTDADSPSLFLVEIDPPSAPFVRFQINNARHGYGKTLWDRTKTDQKDHVFLLAWAKPHEYLQLNVGTGISPSHVIFKKNIDGNIPDTTLPFASTTMIRYRGAVNTSGDWVAETMKNILIQKSTGILANYINNLDNPEQTIKNAIKQVFQGNNIPSVQLPMWYLTAILNQLNKVNPLPDQPQKLAGQFQSDFLNNLINNYIAFQDSSLSVISQIINQGLKGSVLDDGFNDAAIKSQIFIEKPGKHQPNQLPGGFSPDGGGIPIPMLPPFSPPSPVPGPGNPTTPELPHGNSGSFPYPIRTPFDPNDKTSNSGYPAKVDTVNGNLRVNKYYIPMSQAQDSINYVIHFENEADATAPAQNVTITDTLDSNLDASTLTILGTSADSVFSYNTIGNVVKFKFTGINLPPNQNPPVGEGFVSYEVAPKANLTAGTVIKNRAAVVFDANPAIMTPTVTHVLQETADQAIHLTTDADTAKTGEDFTFHLTVNNDGPDAADSVRVTDDLPSGLTFKSAAVSQGKWTQQGNKVILSLGKLSANGKATMDIIVNPSKTGKVRNSVQVQSRASDYYPFNSTATKEVSVVQGTAVESHTGLPTHYSLSQNYPNPFNPTTKIKFALPEAGQTTVRVYNILGQLVSTLIDKKMKAGRYTITWDAHQMASGMYLYRIKSGNYVRVKKMILMK